MILDIRYWKLVNLEIRKLKKFLSFAISQFLFVVLFGILWSNHVQAAILYTSTANQVVFDQATFITEWYLDTQDDEINSVALNLTFTPETLEVLNVTPADTGIDLWIKNPEEDNERGTISLIGGISSGVKDAKVPLFRAVIKPKQVGKGKISMDTSSAVLKNDGLGTPATLVFNEISFNINPADARPALVGSPTHPQQDEWSKNNKVIIQVMPKPGEQYSYSFSSNIEMIPGDLPSDVANSLTFDNLADGIYYFKLNSKAAAGNWQEAAVYRVMIDSTPPQPINAAVASDPSVFDGKPFVSFTGKDQTSGISHYEVRFGVGPWQKTNDTVLRVPGLVLGNKVEIKIVDQAGNEEVTKVALPKAQSTPFSNWFFSIIIIVVLLLTALAVFWCKKLITKYRIK